MRRVREATERILELIEEGALTKDIVILACLKYMSEDDVADMAHINEFFPDDDDEEVDDDDAVEEDCDDYSWERSPHYDDDVQFAGASPRKPEV